MIGAAATAAFQGIDNPMLGTLTPPSPWIDRLLRTAKIGGTALDLACGSGRHVKLLLARGYRVTAVDRDISRLAPAPGLEAIQADLENGNPWPMPGRCF